MKVSSQCPDYLDPEDLILTKWLHNKDWMPASRAGMTAVLRHTAANRHTAIHSRYLLAANK
ncbi:MAG: WPE palindromic element domain-containing protein [Wolbachia sp.]